MNPEVNRTEKIDFKHWAEQLEEGKMHDETLKLAAKLKEELPFNQEAPANFKTELKRHLMEQPPRHRNRHSTFKNIWHWLSYSAGIAILVAILILSQRVIVNQGSPGQEGIPQGVGLPVIHPEEEQASTDQDPKEEAHPFIFRGEIPIAQQVALADLNGNGYLDAYIAIGTHPYPDYILYNDGTGRFVDYLELDTWPSHSVTLGDLTGNGIADVVLDITAGGLVRYTNKGHTLGQPISMSNPGPIGVMSFRPVFGDLTGNGYLDIFAAGCCGRDANMSVPPLSDHLLSYSQVWINNDGRSFSRSYQKIGQLGSNAAAMADLNGSGHLDVFLANGRTLGADGNYHTNTPNTVWFNDGQGEFLDSGQQLGQEESITVALGDLNGNGYPDAVVGNRGSDEVWFNDGQGNFSDSEQHLGDGLTKFVYLADLNGNGHLDLFTSGETKGLIWFNDGSGQFTASEQQILYDWPDAVTIGDLDGNGSMDILVAGVGHYQVWHNDGSGNFVETSQVLFIPPSDNESIPFEDVVWTFMFAANPQNLESLPGGQSRYSSHDLYISNQEGEIVANFTGGPYERTNLLSLSPSGLRALAYSFKPSFYTTSPTGDGPGVMQETGSLLYVAHRDGSEITPVSTNFIQRRTAPYSSALWLDDDRIVLIDQDEQGPGVFLFQFDEQDLLRLSPPGIQPLWLLPLSSETGVYWQAGVWTPVDEILESGPVSEFGDFWWSALDGNQSLEVWSDGDAIGRDNGVEQPIIVLSPTGDRMAYSDGMCLQKAFNLLSEDCFTIQIADFEGMWKENLLFPGIPLSFSFSPSGSDLLVEVMLIEGEEVGRVFYLWYGSAELERLPVELETWTTRSWTIENAPEWSPDGMQILFPKSMNQYPKIFDLETWQVETALTSLKIDTGIGEVISTILWIP